MNVTDFIKQHPIAMFLSITFIWTWALMAIILASFPIGTNPTEIAPIFLILILIGGFGPSVSGLIVTRIYYGKGSVWSLFGKLKRWRVNIGWYVVSLLMIPILAVITLLIGLSFGIPFPTSEQVFSVLLIGLIWPLLAALGEEFGWRGFALPKLQERYNALVTSIIIGLFWGLWHLPMDIFGTGNYGLLFFPNFILVHVISVTILATLMTWIYNNTEESMLMMILFHYGITFSAIIIFPAGLSAIDSVITWMIYTSLQLVVVAIVIAYAGVKRLVRVS
jgi:membrane protease YdiL (CAAX protease family)